MNGESGQETVESLVQMWADQDEQRGKDPSRVMPRHADWMNARMRLLDAVYRSQMEPIVGLLKEISNAEENATSGPGSLVWIEKDKVRAALSAFEKWSKP